MGWFEDQIAYSKRLDEEALSESYINIASAVLGHRIQQSWQDDSYAARTALEDICKYYHFRPREVPKSVKDFNRQLDYVFQPCGFMRRTVKLTEGWHRDAIGAMMGTFRESGKVVALIPGKMGGYVYYSPDTGKLTKITAKNVGQFDDEAIVFYRPLPMRPITIRDIVGYMQMALDFVDVFWYVVVLALVTGLGMLMPRLTNVLFSEVTRYGSVRLLVGIIIFMLCQTLSVQFFSGIKALLLTKIDTKISLFMQSATVMRLFSMPAGFFKNYTSGELNQYVGYMNQLSSAITATVFSTGLTGAFSLAYITQIFAYSPALVVPSLLIILATFAVSVITTLVSVKNAREIMSYTAEEKGMLYSMLSGIQKIRLCGAETRAFVRWGNVYAKEARLTYSPPAIIMLSSVITMAIGAIGTVVLYFEAVKNGVSVADYYSFTTAYAYISAAFAALAGVAQTISAVKPVLQIIKPLMDGQPEVSEDKEIVTRLSGNIELNNLYFRYADSDAYILNDLSLKIRAGQYVAIVGESGCGKSTLIRLLLGLETPQKGSIYYDGKALDTLDKKSLRRKIGVVMQSSRLMQGDIFSNITVCAPWLTQDEAWEAAEIAGIADDIREMPMGMHTVIQEGAGGLSGGQKQRIMIARAVAPKPKILFLDEATSALDNITQKRVSQAMDKLRCTRIVIAHRLSTIRQCDRILYLKDGKVCEDGSYDELIAKNGLFAELVSRQMVSP